MGQSGKVSLGIAGTRYELGEAERHLVEREVWRKAVKEEGRDGEKRSDEGIGKWSEKRKDKARERVVRWRNKIGVSYSCVV